MSNTGKIKRMPLFDIYQKEVVAGYEVKPMCEKGRTQHARVMLSKNNNQERFWVDYLVAETFLDNPNDYPRLIHLDDDMTNNKVDNLKWTDEAEWLIHRKKPEEVKGVYVRCITTDTIYVSITEASRATGLSVSTIKKNCDGRTRWAKDYTIWEYLDKVRTEQAHAKLTEELENIEREEIVDLKEEVWKPVPIKPFNEVYSISNMGRLKSHHSLNKDKLIKPTILKREKEKTGTITFAVNILHYNKDTLSVSLPKLVAELFVSNPKNYTDIRFIDGDRNNYKATNLEWYDSTKDRSERATEIAKLYSERLSAGFKKPVRCIETGYEFESIAEAGRFLGMESDYIGSVCNGKGFTAGGYHWEFIDKMDSYNPLIREGKKPIKKKS